MIKDLEWIAGDGDNGTRLDRFVVQRVPTSTRALAAEAIRQGSIRVNGQQTPKAYRMRAGDRIAVQALPEATDIAVSPNPDIPLCVLYEDCHLVVLDKPAGLPVHPLRRDETATLANALAARYPETVSIGDNPLFPALVHRIDTDTSGVVVAARTQEHYDSLRSQFARHQVVKTYLALVHGRVEKEGAVTSCLVHDPHRRGRMLVAEKPSDGSGERRFLAVSDVRVSKRWKEFTLVEVTIRTGVTHQVRCQLAHLGHPVVGDRVYSSERSTAGPPLARHFLHAWRIELSHPATSQTMRFEAALPEDLQSVLDDLDQNA